ncbi:hypothetical protein G7Y89_g999 [Cudoniella acicularis]|uniref:Acyltransferase 3 domain-containing protein n=1 Tax=Cudoniella acicularis TaxID=354080 RepID=A0A8H4W7E8_9HELO|nr:hypothetical protein G7Y89_g999 [Cudoniella acicularis]
MVVRKIFTCVAAAFVDSFPAARTCPESSSLSRSLSPGLREDCASAAGSCETFIEDQISKDLTPFHDLELAATGPNSRSRFEQIKIYLLPSFIQPYYTGESAIRRKPSPTAYLNGIRGYASFAVFIQHYSNEYYRGEHTFGYHSRPEDVHLIQLPFIRLCFSGGFMVTIFFLLSGYVLAYKPLQLARKNDAIGLHNNIASSIFRRGPRLFLPLIPPMFIASTCIYLGWYGKSQFPLERWIVETTHTSYFGQLGETLDNFWRVISPLDGDWFYPVEDPPFWTLPLEFRGSLLIHVLVLGLSKVKTIIRMTIVSLFAIYSMQKTRWDFFLFASGMILAELRLIRNAHPSLLENWIQDPILFKQAKLVKQTFWIVSFIASLYLGSWPSKAIWTYGYQTIASWTPAQYPDGLMMELFWESIAAVMLLTSLENFEPLQKIFSSRLALYLGDISFSLDQWQSPLWWRLVDENSVKLARWLAVKCQR